MKMFTASSVAIKLNPLLSIFTPTLFNKLLLVKFSNPFHLANIPFDSIYISIYSMSDKASRNLYGNIFY